MEKKPLSKRHAVSLSLVVLVLCIIGGFLLLFYDEIKGDNSTDLSLTQGTQMRYGPVSIGLVSVDKESAHLSIIKKDQIETIEKSVRKGDKFDAFGYTFEIKSINYNRDVVPIVGSGKSNIKFVILQE